MRSQAMRSSRFTTKKNDRGQKNKYSSNKQSQSPTLTSSYSQKSLLAHSYKNQPFPRDLRIKLWGKKFQFDNYSDEIATVMQQEQIQGIQKKVKRLPHFKIIADQGEFISKRSRIKSEFQFRCRQKCKSVQSVKCLPQVVQQKKEQDQLRKLQRSKLSYFKDKNEFNQKKHISSDSHTDMAQKTQSLEGFYIPCTSRELPQQIEQNQAQQTKSVKLPGERSIITAQIQKLIVDELDNRKRKQQPKTKQISQIIEEQKIQQQDQNLKINKLRLSLDRFSSESQYLNQLKDQQCVRVNDNQLKTTGQNATFQKNYDELSEEQISDNIERERTEITQCGEIQEQSSSDRQEDQITHS